MPNRLAKESSPYLLQHQENPVDWYPWGEEALVRARKENKPILLSIGYSACHWCHVMAHESFESSEIAKQMNESFINIKVDREERPDLDQIYQNVAQALTQGGGWPLTVFLTPDLKPFFGGTYFPPEDRYGRPGFPKVLKSLSRAFQDQPESIASNAERLCAYIGATESLTVGELRVPTREQLTKVGNLLHSRVDMEDGGLGSAPKFPNTMIFSFLWRLNQYPDAVHQTLVKMAMGGIYDQLGGGFSRYSVDATWSVPHFEKMLYDNALLLKLYAEVLLSDSVPDPLRTRLYRKVLRETVEYLLREMRSPEGAFYAAQDADSEGEEGKFFAWSLQDLIHEVKLNLEEAKEFAMHFGVSEQGNFEHGKTVLYGAKTLVEHLSPSPLLEGVKTRCFEARSKRVAPGRDDKILTAWNGLAITGLSWASLALNKSDSSQDRAIGKRALEAAQAAYRFIKNALDRSGRLQATFQGGKAKGNAFLDDYAFMAAAALDLARVAPEGELVGLIKDAECWCDGVLSHFKDTKEPGYFFTSDDHEALIQRPKTIYDQAIPSGIAVVLEALLALEEIDASGKSARYSEEVRSQLERLFPQIEKSAFGFGELLCASLLFVDGPIVASGALASEVTHHPRVFRKPSSSPETLICHRKTCSLPVKNLDELCHEMGKHLSRA